MAKENITPEVELEAEEALQRAYEEFIGELSALSPDAKRILDEEREKVSRVMNTERGTGKVLGVERGRPHRTYAEKLAMVNWERKPLVEEGDVGNVA